jgi:hypothetical protein
MLKSDKNRHRSRSGVCFFIICKSDGRVTGDVKAVIGILLDLNVYGIASRPGGVGVCHALPTLVMCHYLTKECFLSLLSDSGSLLGTLVFSKMILLLLKYDLCLVLAVDQIDALVACCVVGGDLLAFENVERGTVYVCQKASQRLIVLLFLTTAALAI